MFPREEQNKNKNSEVDTMICAGEMFAIATEKYNEIGLIKQQKAEKYQKEVIAEAKNNIKTVIEKIIEPKLLKKAKMGICNPYDFELIIPMGTHYSKVSDVFTIFESGYYADGTPCYYYDSDKNKIYLPDLIKILSDACYKVILDKTKIAIWGWGKNYKYETPCLRITLDPKCFS